MLNLIFACYWPFLGVAMLGLFHPVGWLMTVLPPVGLGC
jgi:hypothetical protein